MSVKLELAIKGKLLPRIALAPFGCEEVKIKHGESKNRSAVKLVVSKFPAITTNVEQGPSRSGKNEARVDEEKKDHQPEEPMEQDHD